MAFIKEVHYREVCNLGNYETATIEMVASVNEDEQENLDMITEKLRKHVQRELKTSATRRDR